MRFVLLILLSFLVPTVAAGTEHCAQNANNAQIEGLKEEIWVAERSLSSAEIDLDNAQYSVSEAMDIISEIEDWQTNVFPLKIRKAVIKNHNDMVAARQRLNDVHYEQTKITTHTLSNNLRVYTGFDIVDAGLLGKGYHQLEDLLYPLDAGVDLREFTRTTALINIEYSSRLAIDLDSQNRAKTARKIALKSQLQNDLIPKRNQARNALTSARRELRQLEEALADFTLPYKCCEDCDENDNVKPEKQDDVSTQQPKPVVVEVPELDLELVKPKLPIKVDENTELDDVLKSLEDADPEALPNGSCSSSASSICDPFNPTLADACTEAVTHVVEACEKEPEPDVNGPLAQCLQQCSRHSREANSALDMFDIIIKQIDGLEAQNQSDGALDAKAEKTAQKLETLLEQAEKRIVHIYSNSETNAVVEHDGPYFEPSPPLVYHGEFAIPPTDAQLKMLADIGNDLEELLAEIAKRDDALSAKNSSLAAWKVDAKRVWQNAVTSDVPLDGCVRPEIETGFKQCQSICTAQASAPNSPTPYVAMDFCRKNSSVFGLLKLPSSRKWLVPPLIE